MTPTYTGTGTGQRRRILLPSSAESVAQVPPETQRAPEAQKPQRSPGGQGSQSGQGAHTPLPPQQSPDPPIYRALMRTWADRGRTLPGRHDPEWARLAAPSAMYGYGQFSATRDPLGDGR
ncbi:hypothetical protein [Streptomyces fructofermentans]|uniref:Uncharacterized protein n=1 Tax=Streptomyces fructofermentans TaxID=152141 RepID=A0A918NQK6_9ACTN|nr:hypothetical protein [Streptomyces fructofermentans]GGX87942.1 hypothetical protein GCM10010515_64160 [Streptomyces fructofermentans]